MDVDVSRRGFLGFMGMIGVAAALPKQVLAEIEQPITIPEPLPILTPKFYFDINGKIFNLGNVYQTVLKSNTFENGHGERLFGTRFDRISREFSILTELIPEYVSDINLLMDETMSPLHSPFAAPRTYKGTLHGEIVTDDHIVKILIEDSYPIRSNVEYNQTTKSAVANMDFMFGRASHTIEER